MCLDSFSEQKMTWTRHRKHPFTNIFSSAGTSIRGRIFHLEYIPNVCRHIPPLLTKDFPVDLDLVHHVSDQIVRHVTPDARHQVRLDPCKHGNEN